MQTLRPLKNQAELTKMKELLKKNHFSRRFASVCGDTGCRVRQEQSLKDTFNTVLDRKRLSQEIAVKSTGCLGLCESGPVVIIHPEEIFYQRVSPEDVEEIVEETLVKGELVERLLYVEPGGEKIPRATDIPFYSRQVRTLLHSNWKIDPTSIFDYLTGGDGYSALSKAFTHYSPQEILEKISLSGLRGRGGAGYPTGKKWAECARAEASRKYIICNADEGDPGAFMDRSLLEGNPHSVLEGIIIAGYAIGAREGIIYIREEYPTALEKVVLAIEQAEELGLLGEDILGSGFDFCLKVSVGAGAFVCGETSALVKSIEGKAGEPRQKPPHLAEKGLFGYPTVVNNVETLANVPYIVAGGWGDYSRIGTKIFSLVGNVQNTGLVEVPLGIPLREIIYDIGGGIKGGGRFKAVQTGGPSGGCIPESLLDLPTDFENLDQVGSMMGSGGMIVMDQDTCMVDFAKYFLEFLSHESCGKCFSCREGIARMLDLVEGFTRGEGTPEQLSLLKELADTIKNTSLCGLGKTSPNPVLSTLRYFEEEYLAHLLEKRCPAGVCAALITFYIQDELCNGCGACKRKCPAEAIEGEKKSPHFIDTAKCSKCGICQETCPQGAVTKK